MKFQNFKGREKKYFTKEDIFLSRMASILKRQKGEVMRMFSERATTTIRLNPLVQNPKDTLTSLSTLGAESKIVPWSEYTYTIQNIDKSDLAKTVLYKKGAFYIQNLSSMLPAVLLEAKPNNEILDMCAAPGSKTTQLASILNNHGNITAYESDSSRIEKLKNVLTMFNIRNTTVKKGDATHIGKREEGHYDKILLDAPCSNEGLIYLRGEKPLRFWNIKSIKIKTRLQKELIESAFLALKKNGTLVYSTCTLEPEENEGVVTHLLERYNSAKIEEIKFFKSEAFLNYKSHIKTGIVKWNEHIFSNHVSKTYRVLPSGEMHAFYLAKITKT